VNRVPLARRNLLYNRRRLAAALAGVVFAVVLVNMEVGILIGFIANSSSFIERMPADVWIMASGTPNFDMCHSIAEPTLQRVRAIDGVEWAEKMVVAWSVWKTPDGNEENIEAVGIQPGGHLPIPWPLEPPEAARLMDPMGVIIDRGEQARLKVGGVGDTAEMFNRRVKVIGFTTGLRSFTTTPYAIMRFEDALASSMAPPNTTSYILVKAQSALSPRQLRDRLRGAFEHVDVLTKEEFRARTHHYWLFTTGVGMAFLMAALLGFMVGGAVVGQVLYAMVVEQRAEFGVLKAVGADRGFLCRLVLGQAGLIAISGYAAGLLATLPLMHFVRSAGTPMTLTPGLVAGGFAAVLLVCFSAAILPMVKLMRLEPALVFRG
jgi:putative ABC transport system permease protein